MSLTPSKEQAAYSRGYEAATAVFSRLADEKHAELDRLRRELAEAQGHAQDAADSDERISALVRELAEAQRDAARYRILRRGSYQLDVARTILNDTPEGIDAAVDALVDAAIASPPAPSAQDP